MLNYNFYRNYCTTDRKWWYCIFRNILHAVSTINMIEFLYGIEILYIYTMKNGNNNVIIHIFIVQWSSSTHLFSSTTIFKYNLIKIWSIRYGIITWTAKKHIALFKYWRGYWCVICWWHRKPNFLFTFNISRDVNIAILMFLILQSK